MQILDYSAGYPGAEKIRDAGYGGVIRYLRKNGTSRVRPITAAELADMRAHGLAVALVYQAISTARVLEGKAAGAADASWALQQAVAIGLADGDVRCIYFAADQDIDAAELPRVLAYLDGAASVLGRHRVGIYGEASVVDAAVPGHATWGWQTAAWSAGRRSADAHLFQRIGQVTVGGIACDVNDVLNPDFGQIDYQEDDMPTKDEIREAVRDGVQEALHARYADGRNIADDVKQQTADGIAEVGLLGKLTAAVEGLVAKLDQLDLTAATKAGAAAAIAEGVVKVDVRVDGVEQ